MDGAFAFHAEHGLALLSSLAILAATRQIEVEGRSPSDSDLTCDGSHERARGDRRNSRDGVAIRIDVRRGISRLRAVSIR